MITKVDKLPKEKKDLKIVFMGTPDFAAESLDALVKNGYNVVLCLSQPDRKKGRGMHVIKTPVKEVAEKYNIEVYQPEKLKDNMEAYEKLTALNPDLFVVVAYGKILRQNFLDIPTYGAINVHGSLLPKLRGAAPIQHSIINGDKVTGVTTMFMASGMDTGDMLLKAEVEIDSKDTYETLHDKLKVVGADLLVKTLDSYLEGSLEREEQGEDYTIAPMINKEDCKLDFSKNAEEINNLIRGVNPFPCSYMILEDERRYKVFSAEVIEETDGETGTVVKANAKEGLFIKANDKKLRIIEMQEQNGKRMLATDYLRGKEIKVGTKLL